MNLVFKHFYISIHKCSILILVISLFSGCDASQMAKGVILDKDTKQPINNVAMGKYDYKGSSIEYSKENGEFDWFSVGGTNDFQLTFSKEGYKSLKVNFNDGTINDTIYLEKQ
ncbi:MAG: hypothetical protein WCL14_03215 [Bacteroidota bacterium]